jgi:hypothetical protein
MNMNHFPKVWHFAALLSSFAHLLDHHGDYHEYWLVKKVGISGYCNAQIDYLNMSVKFMCSYSIKVPKVGEIRSAARTRLSPFVRQRSCGLQKKTNGRSHRALAKLQLNAMAARRAVGVQSPHVRS